MTPVDPERARRLLARRDPILAALIKQHGPCRLFDALRVDHFSALARAIIFQQLSTKAAATIHDRLLASLPGGVVTPRALASLTEADFRSAGVSRQKALYLRDLSEKFAAGQLPLESIHTLEDEDVVAALTRVKGIGRWTAEMFLMFRLHRPDVLPVTDLGILTAVQRAYRLRRKPTADRLRRIGEAWKPYRSIACWYLWRSLDVQVAVASTSRTSARGEKRT